MVYRLKNLFFISFCLAIIGFFSYIMPNITYKGNVSRVIDGDSLIVAGREIRLWGIDAPEYHQSCYVNEKIIACGKQASRHLAGLINGRDAECMEKTIDRYQRSVSICKVAGSDIGANMVRDGFAISYGGYNQEEAEAKRAKRGIWAMQFERPADYRKKMSLPAI